MAIGAVLLVLAYPAYQGAIRFTTDTWLVAASMATYLVGAAAAVYALRNLPTDRRAYLYAAIATVLGLAWMALTSEVSFCRATQQLSLIVGAGLRSLALYVAISFLMEEVSFRGLVDAHVHHPGDARPWQSALFVSVLWGVWHLPLVPAGVPVALVVASVLIPHTAVGIPLSFAWHRGGNLALPVVAHSLIDAVRDGLSAAV